MCKHRRAGVVGLVINSKEMVFQHSPCFYSSWGDREGLVSAGTSTMFQNAFHDFLSPSPRQKQRATFGSCSKGQECFTNMIKQCVCLDFEILFPQRDTYPQIKYKVAVLTDSRHYFRKGSRNCSLRGLQSENEPEGTSG